MNIKNTLRILNSPLILAIIILPFFWPTAISYLYPSLNTPYNFLRLCSFIYILVIYLMNRRISKIIIAVFAYEVTRLFSTLLNDGDYWNLAINCGSVLAVCMFVDLMSVKNASSMLKAFLILFTSEVVINLVTIIAYPEGMYRTEYYWQNWFLGYDNGHHLIIMPLLCFFALCAETMQMPSIVKLLLILLFSASIYITWSGASVVAVTVWIILWFLTIIKGGLKTLNIRTILILHIGFFFLVVIARMQNMFKWLIVDILGKDLTFTGRTIRWDIVLKLFCEKPLLGWGVVDTELTRARLLGLSHCHNHFLQILYESGLLGMAFFLATILILDRPLKKVKNKKYSSFISITIFCIIMIGQVNSITNTTSLFVLITMAYHAPQIERALGSDKRRSKVRFVLKKRWST